MCDVDGDNYPDAFRSKWRKARKGHRCCACKEWIRRGDTYRYSSGVWDGHATSFKHCVRCWQTLDILDAINDEPPEFTLACGEVYEGDNQELLKLAFMTPDEAQALVRAGKVADSPLIELSVILDE